MKRVVEEVVLVTDSVAFGCVQYLTKLSIIVYTNVKCIGKRG
jgi:hypothetical protein